MLPLRSIIIIILNHFVFCFTRIYNGAYNDIHTVKKILLDMRKDPEKEFKPVFDSMLAMAEIGGLAGMPVPRRCGRQTA